MNIYISDNCSGMNKVPRLDAPTGPLWHSEQIEIRTDGHKRVAVVNMVWEMEADGEYFLTTSDPCYNRSCSAVFTVTCVVCSNRQLNIRQKKGVVY